MTYALGWSVQKAIYDRLSTSPDVASLVAGRIFDGVPQEKAPGTDTGVFVVLGDDNAQDWSDADRPGAVHTIGVSVVAPKRSFSEAKRAASAVSDALLSSDLALDRGRVTMVTFLSARTKREERDTLRRIDMRFRVFAEDS